MASRKSSLSLWKTRRQQLENQPDPEQFPKVVPLARVSISPDRRPPRKGYGYRSSPNRDLPQDPRQQQMQRAEQQQTRSQGHVAFDSELKMDNTHMETLWQNAEPQVEEAGQLLKGIKAMKKRILDQAPQIAGLIKQNNELLRENNSLNEREEVLNETIQKLKDENEALESRLKTASPMPRNSILSLTPVAQRFYRK